MAAAAIAPREARAQFVCNPAAPAAGDSVLCTVDGAVVGTFTNATTVNGNATTVIATTGSADDIETSAEAGHAQTTNSGQIANQIKTWTTAGGNATTINTSTGIVGGIETRTDDGGDAITRNAGLVFTTSSALAGPTGGNAINENTGQAGAMLTEALAGNATATNFASGATAVMTTSAQGGNALTQNFGQVLLAIQTSAYFGNATTINTGTVQPFGGPSPGISTTTDGGSNASNNGHATTINSGTVNGGTSTLTGENTGGDGNATTINSGTINGLVETISGYSCCGVGNAGNASAFNYGTINGDVYVSAAESFGAGDALLFNSGTIIADFHGVQVTSGSGNASLVNFGTIDLTNAPPSGQGIVVGSLDGSASAYNAGRIYGEVNVVASNFGTATLTNAGLIDASRTANGVAIDMFQFDPTVSAVLNFLPGSRVIGNIGLAGDPGFGLPGTTVNFFRGADISSVMTFGLGCGCGGDLISSGSTVNVFGAPYVISGNTVAVLDPTPFAVADKNLLDVTRTLTAVVSNHLTNPAPLNGSTYAIGFAPSGSVAADMARDAFAGISSLDYARQDRPLIGTPSRTYADGTSVWAQGFGGQRVQDTNGTILRSVNNFYGGMIGVDKNVRPDLRVGVVIGGGNIKSTLAMNGGETTSDFVFGGVYGRYTMNHAFIDFSLLGGHTSNDTSRLINNNLAVSGFETATGRYSGWFINPEIAYGFRHQVSKDWTLTPSARVRYLAAGFGGYDEAGSSTNMSVGSRTTHNFEERGELMLTRPFMTGPGETLRVSSTAGLVAQQRIGDATVNTLLLGQNLSFASPGKNGTVGFFTGAGFDWRNTRDVTVFGATEFTAMSDSSRTITGKGGVRVAF